MAYCEYIKPRRGRWNRDEFVLTPALGMNKSQIMFSRSAMEEFGIRPDCHLLIFTDTVPDAPRLAFRLVPAPQINSYRVKPDQYSRNRVRIMCKIGSSLFKPYVNRGWRLKRGEDGLIETQFTTRNRIG